MDALHSTLRQIWGFDQLRPLQEEAVRATLADRDALVVLPTGGGKSLCYQLPPLLRPAGRPDLGVVISPLIALMKDQVDGLKVAGYPAAALHSAVEPADVRWVVREAEEGRLKLLFVSPERMLQPRFLDWLGRLGRVASFAIDEAHCISQWGHDFRPEYRRLAELRSRFPGVPMQAFTATAPPKVRDDIVQQLQMVDPVRLVGCFDRPNLTYRVVPRIGEGEDQIAAILRRHPGEAAIVYCMTRKLTASIATFLGDKGFSVMAYHAGLSHERRTEVQEQFLSERCDVVVATVAFGMGIDRGDVRMVIHASMPKSVEAYQQETGRAGRDGLPAECVLLYSSADPMRWGLLAERSEVEVSAEILTAQQELLLQMQRLAVSARCRHQALSEYFGQDYVPIDENGCGACDICLGELEEVPDSTTVSRKILSAVARLAPQSYGAAYVADVLRGSRQAKILERGHDKLSTYRLLAEFPKEELVSFLNQLVDLGALIREGTDYPVLRLSATAIPILKGTVPVSLYRPAAAERLAASERRRRRVDATGADQTPLTSEEQALFEVLRQERRLIATDLGVAPFVVLGDMTLMEMARVRPGSQETFVNLRGIGSDKARKFGERFVSTVRNYCEQRGLPLDPISGSRPRSIRRVEATIQSHQQAFQLFAEGASIETVAQTIQRARSTVTQILCDFIGQTRPETIEPWVSPLEHRLVVEAMRGCEDGRLKPIFEALGGEIGYDQIRVVVSFERMRSGA